MKTHHNGSFFKKTSEHRSVDLPTKYMTKDFLSGFRHGFTGTCAQWISTTKTQWNLVCPGFSSPHGDGFRKSLILRLVSLVVIQERCLHMHGNSDIWVSLRTYQRHEQSPSKSLFLVCRGAPRQTIFTYSEGQNGLPRARHTNLSTLVSENMWSPPILIELLVVLMSLQPHVQRWCCYGGQRVCLLWIVKVRGKDKKLYMDFGVMKG